MHPSLPWRGRIYILPTGLISLIQQTSIKPATHPDNTLDYRMFYLFFGIPFSLLVKMNKTNRKKNIKKPMGFWRPRPTQAQPVGF
ncbi:hypothetical protein L873DRAFT_943313 [Choiromyces venosus 120613-1]|uniref:Uncharacterized protein n=1 Tax=Choiromyces venosus 120613-1 TaxID=1336337 RepID=A0A3N4K3E4_9PEZI|nr:hypothetical protein L873DRAFT_943313 [Choiromyces venosus 120613-1]